MFIIVPNTQTIRKNYFYVTDNFEENHKKKTAWYAIQFWQKYGSMMTWIISLLIIIIYVINVIIATEREGF